MAAMPDLEVDCPACGETVRVPVALSSGTATSGILNVVLNAKLAPVTAHAASHAHPSLATLNDGAPMDFGAALTTLRAGGKVSRAGWNGAGMFIVLQVGYPDGIPINANTARATGIAEGTVCRFRPYLMMFTAQGDFVPWVASQSDVLAEDWETVA